MATKSPSQLRYDQLIKQIVTPRTRAAGFRKGGGNYRRRLGTTVQLANLQGSAGSDSGEKRFYVNVGVAFDELCAHFDVPVVETFTVGDYQRRIDARLETLVPTAPERWTVPAEGDLTALETRLAAAIDELLTGLDALTSLQAFRDHPWFERLAEHDVAGATLYALGDHEAAAAWVRSRAEAMAQARGDAPQPWVERIAERLKMTALADLA